MDRMTPLPLLNPRRSGCAFTRGSHLPLHPRQRADSCSGPINPHHEFAHRILECEWVSCFWHPRPQEAYLETKLQPAVIGRLDMLLLQEHKLSAAHASRCGKVLPGRSHIYWEPLIGEQGRSGGVCTSVSESLSQRVFYHGTLIPGRALWIGLELEGSRIGVLNIYAPTDLRHKATFLEDTYRATSSHGFMDCWRDFNNLETMEDQ